VEKVGTSARILARPEASARALILFAAFVSFLLSVALFFGGNENQGIFVGLWVPSILALGALTESGRR
jgi:hypothetical protein